MRTTLGPAVVPVEKVIAHPERIESALLGGNSDRSELGPAHDALDLRKLDADAKRVGAHAPYVKGRAMR